MNTAIDNLYKVFKGYRIGDDFVGCACCVSHADSERLAAQPIRKLTYDDLERYSRKAITTWGTARHFKHFLPRLLELTVEHRDNFLDLAIVFGKLAHAQFDSWPQQERDAVNQFFDKYWDHELAGGISTVFESSIDEVLCALSGVLPSVQRFLDAWIATRTDNAKRHLAAFILRHDEALLITGRLSGGFWDTSLIPHSEVVTWLQSDTVMNYLDDDGNSSLTGDFSFAQPQLVAIRSSLGNA